MTLGIWFPCYHFVAVEGMQQVAKY